MHLLKKCGGGPKRSALANAMRILWAGPVTDFAAFLIALKEMWIEYIIIALLAAPQSKYAAFHSRQALKLDIVSTLLLIVSAVLAFTFIVPIAGAVCIAILFVVRIICFFQVCSGKAKDAAIIGKLPFLK